MQRLFQLLETVAPTSSTILITGETGSGKEVVSRAIHQHSPRRLQRFVALNCSAIPETLLEAELFGHVRGAFTGAVGNRQGRLEQAHKGTLFLDEVGTMSAALQMKLLRVLQEREFERIGDSHTIKVDVRVIAATNSELARLVAAGRLQIDVSDLPAELQQPQETLAAVSTVTLPEGGMDLDLYVANVERELIERSLERTGGNKGQAARLLNLKRTTLVEKLKRFDKPIKL